MSEKRSMIHNPKSGNHGITTIRTSSDFNFHWTNHFHKNPLNFRIYAEFEADNGIINSSIGNKTTKVCKQNPALTGYYIEFELDEFLQS